MLEKLDSHVQNNDPQTLLITHTTINPQNRKTLVTLGLAKFS